MLVPSFSLDFTIATLDTRVTLTRVGATATRVNSSGYIETVAADAPRFDFDPVTLVCRGLLVEQSQQNLLTYSNDFSFVSYGKDNTSISSVSETAPDGAATVTKLSYTTTAGQIVRTGIPFSANTAYTLSMHVKSAGQFTSTLRLYTVETGFATNAFNLSSVTASNGTITPAGNGWFRITISFTTGATVTNPQIQLCRNAASAGDGFYIFGAQLEAGALATSYIPTTSAFVTRNADVATITGTAFSGLWRSGPGSILVRALPSTVSGTRPLVQVDDATADNIIALRGNTTNPELYLRAGGSDQATIDAGTISAAAYRLAGSWKAGSAAASLNSNLSVIAAPANIPSVNQMRLGSDGTNYLNGHLQSIEYYDQRISNANLQLLASLKGYGSTLRPVFVDSILSERI